MSRIYVPHEYQGIALDFLWNRPRANLHMSPGMGKTPTILTHLVNLSLVERPFPVLAIGPLRVANSVWEREVDKWAHLHGVRVSKILGTEAERLAALRRHADVYTINYENLVWLTRILNGACPFRAVVADESTRIKNHRVSMQRSAKGKLFLKAAGGVNAAALIKHLGPKVDYWYNLTGTPAPNGLQDLWGQQFPIDWGKALGNSFTAFTSRWFYPAPRSTREQQKWLPHDHAMATITNRLRPTTISIDAYDWFDVERPRVVDIPVELPEKTMKQYKELHRESLLALDDGTVITAVNAGAKTIKCRQVASGWLLDKEGNGHHIHTAKLDALESLMENLNGAPLLLAYSFVQEREAVLKRFKYAEILPSGAKQKEVEARWNAGQIPMLVVHPASAGHGLDLQHGGHNLCIFSPDWDLELYQQVIERIGPVRQAQAGYDRLVNVYRLVAQDTWDGIICDVQSGKHSMQERVKAELRA